MKPHIILASCLIFSCVNLGAYAQAQTPHNETSTTEAKVISIDNKLGQGEEAWPGHTVTVNYTGWLHDPLAKEGKGKKFDSSIGRAPFNFPLGAGRVIKGWDQGVAGMKVGGQRTLIVPAELGYGARGAGGVIPPNATLIFEIELLGVKN